MNDTIFDIASTILSLLIGGLIMLFTGVLIGRLRRDGVLSALRSVPIEFLIIIILLLVNMFLG